MDLRPLRAQALHLAERTTALERRLDAALYSGRVTREQSRAVNDILMRLEQTLIDETVPARERWYRHVVYGWNIYSLYDGQPLPHLAEAIPVRDPTLVARERANIARALARMQTAVEQALHLAAAW